MKNTNTKVPVHGRIKFNRMTFEELKEEDENSRSARMLYLQREQSNYLKKIHGIAQFFLGITIISLVISLIALAVSTS